MINKSYGMTEKEFYTQACRWAESSSIRTAIKWTNAILEVIIRELYYNGTCRVPGLGTFSTRTVSETYQKQMTPEGKEMVYHVPERQVPIFTPTPDMIDDINMQGVTKHYRKKLKSGTLTQRDWERKMRRESMNVAENLSEERVEKAKENFQEILREKRKKFKGEVDLDEE